MSQGTVEVRCLIIEYTDLHIPVSIFPTTAAILFGIPALVKDF